jgi:hypothetical protein
LIWPQLGTEILHIKVHSCDAPLTQQILPNTPQYISSRPLFRTITELPLWYLHRAVHIPVQHLFEQAPLMTLASSHRSHKCSHKAQQRLAQPSTPAKLFTSVPVPGFLQAFHRTDSLHPHGTPGSPKIYQSMAQLPFALSIPFPTRITALGALLARLPDSPSRAEWITTHGGCRERRSG